MAGSYFVASQATYFPTFVRIYIPTFAIKKDEPKRVGSHGIDLPSKSDQEESPLERSLRRTRKRIREITLCNSFDHFVTLTIAADRQDSQQSKSKIINWIKNETKRKGKFDYIIVPEFHKDQKSLHFHGMFKGYKGEIRQVYNKGYKYNLPSYTSGFSDIKEIDSSSGSISKASYYLLKYITKDMPTFFGKKRYWASTGLKRPKVQDNPEQFYVDIEPDHQIDTEFGKFMFFEKGKHALVDMFIEANTP